MNFDNFGNNFGFNKETAIMIALGIILLVFLFNFMGQGGCSEFSSCLGGG